MHQYGMTISGLGDGPCERSYVVGDLDANSLGRHTLRKPTPTPEIRALSIDLPRRLAAENACRPKVWYGYGKRMIRHGQQGSDALLPVNQGGGQFLWQPPATLQAAMCSKFMKHVPS